MKGFVSQGEMLTLSSKSSGKKSFLHGIDMILFAFFFFFFFRVASIVYESSPARGQTEAAVVSLHHNHINAGSRPCLQPTPQLTAALDL